MRLRKRLGLSKSWARRLSVVGQSFVSLQLLTKWATSQSDHWLSLTRICMTAATPALTVSRTCRLSMCDSRHGATRFVSVALKKVDHLKRSLAQAGSLEQSRTA